MDYLEYLLSRCAQTGIVLDTNIFLLLVVGGCGTHLLPQVKRTAKFTSDDFGLLGNILSLAKSTVVTQGIVTEACNLLDSENKNRDKCFFLWIRELIQKSKLVEDHVALSDLTQHPHFSHLGIADTSVIDLAARHYLVLTDDLPLKVALERQGHLVLNFHNLQVADWIK